MISKIKYTVLFLLLLFAVEPVNSQQSKSIDSLSLYIEQARELFEVPGIAVGIIKDGEIIMNQGFGFSNMSTKKVVDTGTIFGIASCSKAFTAACMAMLVEDSLLAWDDKVVDHYPDFQLNDPYITGEMRIQDLLCHRSGLQTFDGDLLWYGTDYTRSEVVDQIQYREISYSFRSQFGYQNVMYIVAGEVIKEVTGKTWDEYLQDRIFQPLEMESSSSTNQNFTKEMNIAYPHIDATPLEFLDYDNSGPAASINTTSSDLLKWVDMLLNKGSAGDQHLFSEEQYYKLTAPLTLLNAGRAETKGGRHFSAYGLGWFLFDYEGRKIIQHGGGLPGFHSKVVLVPEDNLGFVIIANQISGLVESVYKKILDFYLSDSETDWAQLYRNSELERKKREVETMAEKEAKRLNDTKPSLSLSDYTGTYEDTMYGQAKIELSGNILSLTLMPAETLFFSEMEHWENDSFRIKFNDPFLPDGFVNFHLSDENQVISFTIDLKNPDFHFYKLNFKKID